MTRFSSLISLFLILTISYSYGQTRQNDLQTLHFKKLYHLFFDNEKNKSLQSKILKTYYNKAFQSDSSIYKARYYYMYLQSQSPKKTISCFDSVIKYSLNTGDKSFPFAAYREKAYKLIELRQYDEAIESFIEAENCVKNKNLNLYYKIRLDIAILKSEELGDVKEALEIYKECYKYSNKQKWDGNNYLYLNNTILFSLADAYKTLKLTDSSSLYNRLGYENSILINNEISKNLFILNEGANLIAKKQYKAALDSIQKSLPKIIAIKDDDNIMAGYYYKGKAYEGLMSKELAIKNYTLVDSMYQKSKYIFPEITDGYTYLINYYKALGNKKQHIKYLTALISIDSLLNKKYRNIDKLIRKKYEIPHLVADKEKAIHSLQSKYLIALYSASFFVLSILGLLWYNQRQKEVYKHRFNALLDNRKIPEEKIVKITPNKIVTNSNNIGISEKIISQILNRLEEFETNRKYLDVNINIQLLAEEFETNTKYVSKIINEYKQKSFIQYINDLRINYALNILQTDSKLRKYTISALANEFGFNTAESFSGAFYKKTGIKPSFYIKELENINT